MLLLGQVNARLTRASVADETETAMRPYKPKTGAQLRQKTDPSHRMMRQAYLRRTSTDKTKDARYDKIYYRRNKAQLRQRSKRSRQLHSSVSEYAYHCYEYAWADGLKYSIVVYADQELADATAKRLNLMYQGSLSAVVPWDNSTNTKSELKLAYTKTYENFSRQITASVYAGHKNSAARGNGV